MRSVAAFVLAGGRVMEMGVLTRNRAKAAVPIAGHYRIIDFAMSNLSLSGVDRVGVLSQYRPSSLMDHVGIGEPWGLVGRGREVRFLTPYQADKAVDWYRGTADAVYQNLGFLEDEEWVLILSGDHVYQMDYRPLLERAEATGADLVMAFKRFPGGDCSRFGNALVDAEMRVLQYLEKPEQPVSDLGSLTIYLFRREVLVERLQRLFASPPERFHLYETIVPDLIREGRVRAEILDGYWAYARTVDDYYQTCMDLLRDDSGFDLDRWDVLTNTVESGVGAVPPAHVGPRADLVRAWISPGSQVGGRVIRSVISPGVVIEEGAEVVDCVLLHGVRVEAGARLQRVVADKYVVVQPEALVGHGHEAPPNRHAAAFHQCGVTVLGRRVVVGSNCTIGANCELAPDVKLADGTRLADGESLNG